MPVTLIGEIRVDELDTDDGPGTKRDEDAATSSRQKIVEDDSRYAALKAFLVEELKHIQNQWRRTASQSGCQESDGDPSREEVDRKAT